MNVNKSEKNVVKYSLKLALCAFFILLATTLTGAFSLPERVDFYPIIPDATPDGSVENTFSERKEKQTVPENSCVEEPAQIVVPEDSKTSAVLPVVPINAEKTVENSIEMSGYETVSVFDVSTGNIAVMPFEEYILGVLLSEMPTSFEDEALKAQAIACRSYTVYKQSTGAYHKNGAQLCTSPSHCQAFCPPESVSPERYEKAKAAVDLTRGEIMCYDGAPVLAVFHASSDGKTCSSEEVWGGKLSYLSSVDTAECFNPTMDITKSYTFSTSVFSDKLGIAPECVSDTTVEKSASGRVTAVKIGEKSVSGGDFVRLFGLRSNSFDMVIEAESVVITCSGYGHGVGMSQYGAQDMAQKGYTCREILAHYYTGVSFGTVE